MDNKIIQEYLEYLNLIHQFSVFENAVNTQRLIQNISNLLKYKFIRKDEIVTLKDEISFVDVILEIFIGKYGECVNYKSEINGNITDVYIPNYSVLTFVECSLFNSFESKENNLNLNLCIDYFERNIKIKIQDDNTANEYSKENTHLIDSVIFKYNSFFSMDSLIDINFNVNKNTIVKMEIPKIL
ncbi:MAG: hypothetical protein ABF289_08880 [Clostridiales bacterium]